MKIDLEMKSLGHMSEPAMSEKRYPTLHFETSEDHEIPDSGTMTIRFDKKESSARKSGGKTVYSCTVEVHEIMSMSGKKSKSQNNDDDDNDSPSRKTAKALDKLRFAKMKKANDDEDEDY